MHGEQILTYNDAMYLAIGVEDGWIHVTPKVWKEYLKAKEVIKWKQKYLNLYQKSQNSLKNNFNEAYNYSTITQFLIWEYGLLDESYDKPRRWNQIVEGVVCINGRYFSVCYDRGLTEMQENDYDFDDNITEVEKRTVLKEVTEWKKKR